MISKNKKGLIIFDLDGTLYKLPGGSFAKSPLKKRVLANAQNFIAKKLSKSKAEAKTILGNIQEKYGEDISIGLEKEYGLSRYDYFNTAWDVSTRGVVRETKSLRKILAVLKKRYNLALVSDAPQVWINNVLKALSVQDIFRKSIFSGEGNRRKGFGNAFSSIMKEYSVGPADCIAVGDQEATDIIPAKKLGIKTVLVAGLMKSTAADLNIKSIYELSVAVKVLES